MKSSSPRRSEYIGATSGIRKKYNPISDNADSAKLLLIDIPSGISSYQIVKILRSGTAFSGYIGDIPLEGSLAPGSYYYRQGVSRKDFLDQMRRIQEINLSTARKKLLKTKSPLRNAKEVLVLASILELETNVASTQRHLAAVLLNRLSRGMKLQSPATLVYALTSGRYKLNRELRRSDRSMNSPYNTWVIDGLPPKPIGNPGRAAIFAALNPEPTDELYFVGNMRTGHFFASSLSAHINNVRKFKLLNQQ